MSKYECVRSMDGAPTGWKRVDALYERFRSQKSWPLRSDLPHMRFESLPSA